MDYQLNLSEWGGMVAFPSCAMAYIREVSGNHLKVLLTILNTQTKKPSPEEIASINGLSVEEVNDGIRFWIEKQVFSNEKSGVVVIQAAKPGASAITSEEIAHQMGCNDSVRCLLETSEHLYGRPLNLTERRVILYISQSTLLPVDVILMIIEYCIRIDKQSVNYILKVCDDWAEKEINTHEKVEEQIKIQLEKNDTQKMVCSCFGIRRKLSKKEENYIENWFNKFGFTINMIRLAYERCIDSITELSFPYINEILKRWHSNSITTPEQASRFDVKAQQKQDAETNAPSYDLNELSKRGLFVPEL